jgi:DNA-binding winged helix-turn-helix (wHTH) protein
VRVRFGPFVLDSDARLLVRDGRELRLSPKAFDLLVLLLERRPAVVDKGTLRARLWPATHVVDASLSNLVAEIRALGGGQDPPPVRTVHGVGYAFAGEAQDLAADQSPTPPDIAAAHAAPCWVVWRDRPIPLAPGDNLVGRDASCTVWLDESGVSRRHARIHVAPSGPAGAAGADGVTVEDLDSTNGTFLRGRAVIGAVSLQDGDRLQVGTEVLVFRSRAAIDAPTRRVRRASDPGSLARSD